MDNLQKLLYILLILILIGSGFLCSGKNEQNDTAHTSLNQTAGSDESTNENTAEQSMSTKKVPLKVEWKESFQNKGRSTLGTKRKRSGTSITPR
jgi:type III secretory pathway component EscV